jgi:hypothetical protein
MVPGRERRRTKLERGSMRLVATGGIIGIAVLLARCLWPGRLRLDRRAGNRLTSVILAALLWSSRQL